MTDKQWELIEPLLSPAKPGGCPHSLDMRQVINAILYLVVGGIQWRLLPKEYPKWQSVYNYFRMWRDDGTWQRIHDTLRAEVRRQADCHKHPTAGSLDSQSVKTGTTPNGVVGFDSGKRVNGRKRQVLVDTCGLLLTVLVTSATVQDRDGAQQLLQGRAWLGSTKNTVLFGSMGLIVAHWLIGWLTPSLFVSNLFFVPRGKKGLFYWLGGGLLNEPLLSWAVIGVCPKTMNAFQKVVKPSFISL